MIGTMIGTMIGKELEKELEFECNVNDIYGYELIIEHNFSEIDLLSDKLSYFITVNKDKIFLNESDTVAIYYPELRQRQEMNSIYKSTYFIPSIKCLETDKVKTDKVKIKLILPFDYKTNINKISMHKLSTN